MTIAQTGASKLFVAFVALAMLFSVAPVANAQTTEELQAQIAALMAQIQALQGQIGGSTTTSCATTFARDLGQGSTGADVMALQKFLNQDAETRVSVSGAGSVGMETQYYGPATAAAVSKFQVKYRAEVLTPLGLVNPTGYFGASSRAKANALCATGTPGTPGTPSGDLEGGAGSLDDADFISSIRNEEVGEGQSEVEVLGLELEADDNSDLRIAAVRVEFEHDVDNNENGSDDLDDYADEVIVLFEGEEVGSVDVDDMNESNDVWSRTITIDDGAIIRSGDVADLVVAVSALNNIDQTDLDNNNWSVKVASVRYMDAQGAVITDSSTGDINVYRTFEFVDFATAANIEMRISKGDTNINNARVIKVSDSDDEEDVEFFSFTVEVRGDSDLTIDEIIATSTFTGTATQLNDIFAELSLYMDGDEVGSETASASEAVTFEDLELELEAGETYEFVIKGDILEYDAAGTYDLDGTIKFSIGTTERQAWDVEDEEGDDLANGERKGSASSDAHTFSLSDVTVDGFDWSVSSSGATIEFSFNVDAEDEDFTFATSTMTYTAQGTGTTSAPTWIATGDDVTAGASGYTVGAGSDASFRVQFPVNGANGSTLTITLPSVAGVQIPTADRTSPTASKNVQS